MTIPCRTTLIEPNQLFREGLKHLLAGTRFDVSSEFSARESAVRSAPSGAAPDLPIPDLLIIGLSNSDARDLRPLREAYPATRIVVLADGLTVDSLREAMAAGIDGFLIKDVSPEALIQSLHLIMLGEKVFPTNLAPMLIQMSMPTAQPDASFRGLSPREQEILQALVTGASNKLIASRLGITEATVKVHLKTLLRKIDVANRTQAAIWALNHGFGANATNGLRAVSASPPGGSRPFTRRRRSAAIIFEGSGIMSERERVKLQNVTIKLRPNEQYFIGQTLMLRERLTREQWRIFERSADAICNSILGQIPADYPDSAIWDNRKRS